MQRGRVKFLGKFWKSLFNNKNLIGQNVVNMHTNNRLLNMVPCCILVTWCITGVVDAQEAKTAAIRLYVAPGGNDRADGSEQSPLATLGAAKQNIRTLKKTGTLPVGGVMVIVRGGTYFLAETFQFDKADSGTVEAPIVYRAAEGEKVQIFGGRPITGFVPHQGSILKTNVASQGLKGVNFRQLFFNNKRQHLARYPNYNPNNPYGGGWAYVDGTPVQMYKEVPGEDKCTLHYKATDARTWSRPTDGEVCIFPRFNWWNNIEPIAAIDHDKRTITLAQNASYGMRPNDRYYVQGLLEELDSPGEWYLDRETDTLYFWPSAALKGKQVYAPTLRTLITMSPGTSHVTIRGFDLQCCVGTAVELRGTDNCLIAGNTIRNVGDYRGDGVSVDGGRRNGVVGNDIYEAGRSGVALSGGDRITLAPAENYADNNYIHHVGVFFKQGLGITLNGVGNRVSHNLIHDTPRCAIGFKGNNLVIEYNHLRHVMLETEDSSALSTGGCDWISSRGSILRYNYIHDVIGYATDKNVRTQAFGIYPDDNAGGLDIIGNIVVRATAGPIFLHNCRDTVVENNMFIDGPSAEIGQVTFSGWLETSGAWQSHLPEMINGYESVAGQPAWSTMRNMNRHPTKAPLPNGMTMRDNVFQRNIFYYSGDKTKLFHLNNVPLDYNKFDYNLVYHFDKPLTIDLFPFPPARSTVVEDKSKAATKTTLEADAPIDQWPRWWRAEGQDQHSMVADPLFVNSLKDDYRLKPDSPAFKLGFKPIPFEKIGPYADPLRASWPIIEGPGARDIPRINTLTNR